jgi:hypothetical protein
VRSITAQATGPFFWQERPRNFHFPSREKNFQRVGTFADYRNNGPDSAAETVSEIIAATADGRTLVYTDGVRGTIGLIDITNPGQPQPLGTVTLDPVPGDDVDYSPTSVDVLGNRYALVAANTSESNTNTSGKLVVVDLTTRAIVREIDWADSPIRSRSAPTAAMRPSSSRTNGAKTSAWAARTTARNRVKTSARPVAAYRAVCPRRRMAIRRAISPC